MTGMDRREFLRWGIGATLAAPLVLAACDGEGGGGPADVPWDPGAIPEDEARFPLGVQAGAVRADEALLWTFAEGAGAVRLRVWRPSDRPGRAVIAVDEPVAPVEGYVKVPVGGLEADTAWSYAFLADDGAGGFSARSRVGTFRTAFAPGTRRPLTLGVTSCTNFPRQPWVSLEILAARGVDAFCHLGDFAYNDEAFTQAEYRALWRQVLTDPGYRAILPSCGLYATLDDHEVANNFSNDPDFPADRRRIGLEAWFETVAVPRLGGDRVWDSYRWGDTAEIFVLDTRTGRRPETRLTPEAELISEAQLAWLLDGLRASPCHFKIILNSVPIIRFPADAWGPPEADEDKWPGYPAQRDRLLDALVDDGIENVWFLSGDMHIGLVARVEAAGPRRRFWEILGGPGGPNGLNPLLELAQDDPEVAAQLLPPEQFAFGRARIAATTVTFDPDANDVRVVFIDAETEEILLDTRLQATA